MTTADPVLSALAEWAESREDVRALILTSTRAVPDAELDAYSDYDVVVVVADVRGIVKTCGSVCLRLLADLLVVDLGRWFVRRVCR